MSAKSIEFKIGGLFAWIIYLGIGAMLHAVFVGAQFDWSSAWTWGWLLGWPVMLFVVFWAFALIIAVVVAIVVFIMALFGKLS